MFKHIINRIRSKLFLKISLVFVFSLLAIVISVFIINYFVFMSKDFPGFMRHSIHHADFMITQIGFPPDLKRAGWISSKTRVPISIRYKKIKWESERGIMDPNSFNFPPYKKLKGISAGFTDLGFCVGYKKGDYRVLMVMHPRKEGFRRLVNTLIMTLLTFALLVIIVLYFFIRWLLRPVKVLKEGVDQIGKGNLDLKMDVKNSDELGKLTLSFNDMTGRISEMLASRDQLLRDVSHELRSPLTRIKVGLEFMEDSDAKKGIAEDVSELEMMISELLETDRLNSRFGKLKLEKINIYNLIKNIIKEFDGKKPGIVIDGVPAGLNLNIDRTRILILFRNIFSNALRYSYPDGKPVQVNYQEDSGDKIILIKDFGIGIPEDELPYIFEPFYRVDKSRSRETGGYGLGLSLSKKIMEAHKGLIEINSSQGIGTTIKLTFNYSE